jgi:hypothetical protein
MRSAVENSALLRAACLLLLLLAPGLVLAHHSRAEYSTQIQELRGKLVSVLWRNPHPAFVLDVENGDDVERWQVEGWSALYTFERAGIDQDRFKTGDTLKIAGYRSTRRPDRLLAANILLSDGTEAILKRDAEPYFTAARHLGGRRNWEIETKAAVVDAARENRGFFRVWSYPAPAYSTKEHVLLTKSAEEKRSEFDQVDNYIMRCEQKPMPGSMVTPNPYEFIDHGDTITIRGYEGDVVRTVHMDASLDPQTQPRSRQGFSVGRWENERTLVIRTTRIDGPNLGFSGIFLSENAEVVERYTLSEDQTRIDFRYTVTDPQTFTEPATFEYYWLALGESFGRYDCDVH